MIIDGRFLEQCNTVEGALDAWLIDGTAAFEKFRFHGFIAAWNADASECVVLRGKYGIAPGYIADVEHGVVFSSDLTTLIQFGIDSTPNEEAIDSFLTTGYFPSPLSPIASISKLAPGHSISITTQGASPSKPWLRHTSELVSREEAFERVGERFTTSLERAWPNDSDAGLLLSGGVDSALILAGVTKMLDQPIRAFTFRYEDYHGILNEGGNARAIADYLGVPHEEISIRPQDMLDDLDDAVTAYGEPFTWGLHSYRLSPVADQGITTVFCGAGADGWSLSKRHRAALQFKRLPKTAGGALRAAVRAARPLHLANQAKAEWTTRSISDVGELYSPDSEWSRHDRRRLYRDPSLADRGAQRLHTLYEDAATEYASHELERALVLLDKRFNAAETMMLWNRSWTLAAGLELRLPYYDHDLLDLGMNIERPTTGKDALRQLAGQYLPNASAQAPKIPQQMPVGDWLRGPLREPLRERLTDLPHAMTTIFDFIGIGRLIDEHVEGRANHGWRLIALLTTASWLGRLPS